MLTYLFNALFNLKKIFCFFFHTDKDRVIYTGNYCSECDHTIYDDEQIIYVLMLVFIIIVPLVVFFFLILLKFVD